MEVNPILICSDKTIEMHIKAQNYRYLSGETLEDESDVPNLWLLKNILIK